MPRRASGKRKRGRCAKRARLSSLGMTTTTVGGFSGKHAARRQRRLEEKEKRQEQAEKEGKPKAVDISDSKAPRSFVFARGKVGKYGLRLMRDLRNVMEPFTASKLKVTKRNNLKDFVVNAGPVGVTDLLVLTRSDQSLNLRLIRVPQGPTITFRVLDYSLAKDVRSAQKKPVSVLFNSQPLVVLNNFGAEKHLGLTSSMLQNMFPSINVDSLDLNTMNRCVLFNYDSETDAIELRHYKIKTVAAGLSKSAKKLIQSKVPRLGKYKDISEYFLDPGQLSESEYEQDQDEVDAPPKLKVRGVAEGSQTNVRLAELGPRLKLSLMKIEESVCEGEVLYHAFVHKSQREVVTLRKEQIRKKKLKEKRRVEQEKNVIAKMEDREAHKQKCIEGAKKEQSTALEKYEQRLAENEDKPKLSMKRKREREEMKPKHKQLAKKKRVERLEHSEQ